MDSLYFLLILAVLLLYIKWIVVVLLFIPCCLRNFSLSKKGRRNVLFELPFRIIDLILKGGGERFLLYHISFLPSIHLRYYCYKALGVKANDVVFHFQTEIRAPWKLSIGKGSIIGDKALLDARNGIILGKNVNLSSNVSIYSQQHDYQDPMFRCTDRHKMSVEIDDRVWIGANVIILPGVHIGEGAVCCAGCVVTKDVEPFTVVGGIPAKKVATRPNNLTYTFSMSNSTCRLY